MENIAKIVYINLDRRKDRRAQMEAECERMGLQMERFSAIPHETIGLVGCGLSHLNVLKQAKQQSLKNVLILEDDFQFSVSREELEKRVEELFTYKPDFDVCMFTYFELESEPETTDCPPTLRKVKSASTAACYIVNEHYYGALIEVLQYAMPLLEATNHHWVFANDQVWKELQKKDNWVCVVPEVGHQREGYSDCSNSYRTDI